MKFWPFKRSERKASAAGRIMSSWMVGRPVWTERDFENLSQEAYLKNAVAFRCTKLIAGSAASVPWLLHGRGGKEIEEHPLLSLLTRPNPVNGGNALFEALYAYLLLSGNTYLEEVGPDNKEPRELWCLRSDRMKVIPGSMGMPQGYEYSVNGQTQRWDVDPIKGGGPILHVKEFHPLNDWYGLGRVEPAAYGIDRHNASSEHNKALLDNGARPSGALVFEPVKVGDNSVQAAPKEVIDAAEQTLAGHTGPGNAGRPLVFGGNVDWLPFGVNPREMDFAAGKEDAARDICLSFDVPHILIVPGSATYNNVKEAKLELWEQTILPLLDHAIDELNNWLAPKFGDDLKLSKDLDAIPALEPRREAKRASTVLLLDKGVIDADEARQALQYGPRTNEAVGQVDGAVLKALVDAIETTGFQPLIRYMRSVGLYEPGMSDEQIISAATAHLEDEADLHEDSNTEDEEQGGNDSV